MIKTKRKYARKTELLSIRLQIIVMQLDELSVFYYYWRPHAMVRVFVVVVTHPYHLNITEHTSHVINVYVCVIVHVHMHIPFPLIWLAKCQYVHQTNKSPEAYLCRLHEYMYASIYVRNCTYYVKIFRISRLYFPITRRRWRRHTERWCCYKIWFDFILYLHVSFGFFCRLRVKRVEDLADIVASNYDANAI